MSLTVLGIGNPLLDISVLAPQTLFDKYDIKAGTASLAQEKDKPLFGEIQAFSNVAYLAGGATQNSIRGFAWLNPVKGRAHMIGCVGDDPNAEILRTSASTAGVQTHYNISNKNNPTGRCAVLVNEDKERSLVADLSAANDYDHQHFMSTEIQEIIQGVDIFYSAGFFLTVSPETQVEIGKYCLANGKVFAINLSAVFIMEYYWDALNSVLPYADYVLCNEDEAAAFAKKIWLGGRPRKGSCKVKSATERECLSSTHCCFHAWTQAYHCCPERRNNVISSACH